MRKRDIQRSVKRSLKGIVAEMKRIENASGDIVDSLLRVDFPGDTVGAMVQRGVAHYRQDAMDNIVKPSGWNVIWGFKNYGVSWTASTEDRGS